MYLTGTNNFVVNNVNTNIYGECVFLTERIVEVFVRFVCGRSTFNLTVS